MRCLLYILLLPILVASACDNSYSPKPRGYHRIEFPQKAYKSYRGSCPYSFEYPDYAVIKRDSSRNSKPCWLNMNFPTFNGSLHLSYQPITSREVFFELTEDARTFAFKHTVKATAIDEGRISYPHKKVYGIYYSIKGNTASSIQFFLTDSANHYLRGALYFNEEPRLDSIQPVLDFIEKDVDVFIKSFTWH